MKICLITNSLLGLHRFRIELIKELLKNSDVHIITPKDEYITEFMNLGCKLHFISLDRRSINIFKDLRLFLSYLHILHKLKPDVVLTYTIKPNIYAGLCCRLLNIPQIANITGLGSTINKKVIKKILIFLYRKSLYRSNCIFCQNEENLQFMKEHKIGRIHKLIPGSGVNLTQYKVLPYPENEIIQFVFISRIMREKGINEYLEAARHFKNKGSNYIFHVVGNSENTQYLDLMRKLHEEKVIMYHGFLDNILDVLSITHCTIHPTFYPEGMSNVLLESASCGRPLITTNISGCKEIVEDGINGFIIKQRDSKDLIEKIEKFCSLTNSEKKEMGVQSRRLIEKRFNRQIIIDEYLKHIYTRILQNEKEICNIS